jgi:hypothetical protein
MISDKQLQANRANAQKSTGPKTEEGKSIVSKNATFHGLRSVHSVIDGEDPAEYNDFRNDMIAQLDPIGPMEALLVDRIVHSAWRLRRIGSIESEVYDFILHSAKKESDKIHQVQKAAAQAARSLKHIKESRAKALAPRYPFSSFAEAKSAWDKSFDGILLAQNKWPTDSGCPSPNESFSKFIEPAPTLDPDDTLFPEDYHALAKTESDNAADTKQMQIENQDDQKTGKIDFPLGQAIANDFQSKQLLIRLSRYETTIERSMLKNLHQLRSLQQERKT